MRCCVRHDTIETDLFGPCGVDGHWSLTRQMAGHCLNRESESGASGTAILTNWESRVAKGSVARRNQRWTLSRFLRGPAFRYGVGIIVVTILPSFLRWPGDFINFTLIFGLQASIIGSMVCFLVGTVIARQLTNYPNAHGYAYAVPIFMVVYGILITVFFFGRIDFSRYQILTSFPLSVAWFVLTAYLSQRNEHLKLAILPFGVTDQIAADVAGIELVHLEQTDPGSGGDFDAVVADLRADMPAPSVRFLAACALERIPVYHVKQVFEWLYGRVHIEHLSENQFGSLLIPRAYEAIKRAADILIVLLLAPVLLPLLAVLAILVRLDSPGSALFIQTRMGFRGVPFRMYKYRTMHVDQDGPAYTEPDDARVTRMGRWMRRYRLDELPQVINILKSEMSWIGPRPETLELSTWYEGEVPFYRYRHIVRPGITGWAQVNQGQAAGVGEAEQKLQYDFFYIKHFSPLLDLLIVFKTFRILVTGFGVR